MMAMGLSRAYRLIGDYDLEEKFLILAAMTDTKLGVQVPKGSYRGWRGDKA